jgi:hypothetical protein
MNPYAILGTVCLAVFIFFGGWTVRGWYQADVQIAANTAAVNALLSIRKDLQPKVTNYYNETTKYPDCHATKEGHDALLGLYK